MKELTTHFTKFKDYMTGHIFADQGVIGRHMKTLYPRWGETLLGIDRVSLGVEDDISEILIPLQDELRVLAEPLWQEDTSSTAEIDPTLQQLWDSMLETGLTD